MSVPILSMAFMALAALFCFAMPVLLLIYYKRKGADVLPFFIGCAVFVIFALILESLMHQLVLKVLPVGKTILENTLLYALYGGRNALMYGAGHGGIEAILIVGLTYIGNIVISMLINAGQTDMLMATATGEVAEQMQAVFDSLIATAPWTYLLAIVERIVAITTHVCLSVLVWFAVKKSGKFRLFPLAILLHAALDGLTVILAARLPAAAVEGCLVVMTLGLVFLTRALWKKNAEI